jgi:serine/threonine-protein kinase RsbW
MTSDSQPAGAVVGIRILLDQEFTEADLRSIRNSAAAYADSIGLTAARIGDLELIVSELAANAIRHGGGQGRIRLWISPDEIVCEVSDQGAGLSALPLSQPRPEPSRPGGRGLWLVITYADAVDLTTPPDGGTVITARLRRTAANG